MTRRWVEAPPRGVFLYQDECLVGQIMRSNCCSWAIADRRDIPQDQRAMGKQLPGSYPKKSDAMTALECYFDNNPIKENA